MMQMMPPPMERMRALRVDLDLNKADGNETGKIAAPGCALAGQHSLVVALPGDAAENTEQGVVGPLPTFLGRDTAVPGRY